MRRGAHHGFDDMPANRFKMKVASRVHLALYRITAGRITGTIAGLPILLLTTTGRKTRRRTTIPLVYLRDGRDVVVIGSNGGNRNHPSWYANLLEDQRVEVQIRGDKTSRLAATASGAERDRLWQLATELWPGYAKYQEETSRLIPLVVLREVSPPEA